MVAGGARTVLSTAAVFWEIGERFPAVVGAETVTSSALPDDLEIAPGHTVGCWKSLKLDPGAPNSADWDKACKIFDARIRRRFLDPVDKLIEFDQDQSRETFGFAILAIDFLVIETLQGFRDGIRDHSGESKALFTRFLVQWDCFKEYVPVSRNAEKLAEKVYRDYRCALHHSGSTEGAFRVGTSGPVFDFKDDHECKINRTCLHEKLKYELVRYLAALREPEKVKLRSNFLDKMNALCGIGPDRSGSRKP